MSILHKILDNPKNNLRLVDDFVKILKENSWRKEEDQYLEILKSRFKGFVLERFYKKLGDSEEITAILENINFTVDDLLIFSQYITPKF